MAIEVTVPRLGWSMDEGTLVEWLKRDGDFVRKGEMLFSLEGDKATQEIESFDEGVLRFFPGSPQAGEPVKVGQLLAFLLAEGEAMPEHRSTPSSESRPLQDQPLRKVSAPAGHANVARDVVASPRARRTAERLGVDWEAVPGTGRNGRIRERDIVSEHERLQADVGKESSTASAQQLSGKIIPLTPLRRTIAARMIAVAQQTVPVTLTTHCDASEMVALRKSWRQSRSWSGGPVPSHTDIIVKLVATALEKHPGLQTQWRAEGLFVPDQINIGVAVDTEAGLIVPVVRDVAGRSIGEVAVSTRELIDLARTRRLTPDQTQGGTFTVTSLGTLGIDAFTPVLNMPQSAILGVGRIALEPAVVGDAVVPRHRMWLSLTFDHRVLDGAPAARFLSAVKDLIEQPDCLR